MRLGRENSLVAEDRVRRIYKVVGSRTSNPPLAPDMHCTRARAQLKSARLTTCEPACLLAGVCQETRAAITFDGGGVSRARDCTVGSPNPDLPLAMNITVPGESKFLSPIRRPVGDQALGAGKPFVEGSVLATTGQPEHFA